MKSYASLGLMTAIGCLFCGCESGKPATKIESEQQINPGEHLLAKLDKIIIPVVDFEDATVAEAFDFIRLRSFDLDPETDSARKGVSYVIRHPGPTNSEYSESGMRLGPDDSRRATRINFKAGKIKILDLIAEIAERARLDAYLTSKGMVILPEGEDPIDDRDGTEIWKVLRKTSKTSL